METSTCVTKIATEYCKYSWLILTYARNVKIVTDIARWLHSTEVAAKVTISSVVSALIAFQYVRTHSGKEQPILLFPAARMLVKVGKN